MGTISIKACVLASGSKGNCTYLETKSNRILIDIGTTCLYAEKKLKDIGIEAKTIDSVFITHTHTDHTAGLKVFLKKHNPTVYLTSKMYQDLKNDINLTNYIIIEKENIILNDLVVEIIKTSHDASDSNGYIFNCNSKKICYITDTGYINRKNYKKIEDCNIYIMESNHDVELLMNGNYPYHLKQRILGDKGHLSNKDSSYYLSHLSGKDTKCIVLAHLSEENNDPNIALTTLCSSLKENNKNIDKIIIATQKERTELIEV